MGSIKSAMMTRPIRWLHISDIRCVADPEMVKTGVAQRQQFARVAQAVQQRVNAGFVPDFLFVTGDLAATGTDGEYENFRDDLLLPLQRIIGNDIASRTLVVPGDHDVSRGTHGGFDRAALRRNDSLFFAPRAAGRREREIVQPRLEAFRRHTSSQADHWLLSELGCRTGTYALGKPSIKVGVVLTNTCWLSKDDQDYGELTPGSMLVEHALKRIEQSELRIVVGHHPLDWLDPEEREIITELFRVYRVIYLHGHVLESESSSRRISESWPVYFQGEALYRPEGERSGSSGFVWGQLSPTEKEIWFQTEFWTDRSHERVQSEMSGNFPDTPERTEFERPFYLPLASTRFTRRTRNNHVVYEHVQRADEDDVGPRRLRRSRLLVDEALAVFNRVLLLGESGSGRSFALTRLLTTLARAVDANDPSLIRSNYPDWRHAPLPMPLKVDASDFNEWLSKRSDAEISEGEVTRSGGKPPLLLQYVAENPEGLHRPEVGQDLAALEPYCHRESFVLVVDRWGALNAEEAARVNGAIQEIAGIGSAHRPGIFYAAALDSTGYEPPFDDGNVERIIVAKMTGEVQDQFAETYCVSQGRDARAWSSMLERMRPLCETPGNLKTVLDEWRRQAFPEVLKGCEVASSIYFLKIKAALGPHFDSLELEALGKLLIEAYLMSPPARLLKFGPGLSPSVEGPLIAADFLRRHKDGRLSIKQRTLQDYIAGWALSRYSTKELKEFLANLLASKQVRREPLKRALFWIWGQSNQADALVNALKTLLSYKESATAIITIADFMVEAGSRVEMNRILPLLKEAREGLTALVSEPAADFITSFDRFSIGRALGFCGDIRNGVGINAAVDLPEIEWKEIAAGEARLGQTHRDLELYGETRVAPNDESLKTEQVRAFRLSKYPITNIQFDAFVKDPIYGYSCEGPWRDANQDLHRPAELKWKMEPGTQNHPAASVSWDEAKAFCVWYSRMTGQAIDLPTSVQWEYAARGNDDDRLFPFPNEDSRGRMNSQEEGLPGVTAVGVFPGSDSPFQISDMCGNVFEWCDDSHREDQVDFKVTKGGSYNHDLLRCRNATRGKKHHRSQHPYLGFRVQTTAAKVPRPRIILAGGGFAGICTAIRLMALAERPIEIVIVDRARERFFGGWAYSEATAHWEHLFNLQAGRISLYRESRLDFVQWINALKQREKSEWHKEFRQREFDESSAVPRRLYQQYLRDRTRATFAEAHKGVTVRAVEGEVVAVKEYPNRVLIRKNGQEELELECDQLILCTGNLQIRRPKFLTEAVVNSGRYFAEQYTSAARAALRNLEPGQRVLVLGSGLRAYDVVMTLRSGLSELSPAKDGVAIALMSRHGRLHPRYPTHHVHKVVEIPKPGFLNASALSKEQFVEGVITAFRAARNSAVLAAIPETGNKDDPTLRSERILKAWEQYVPEAIKKLRIEEIWELLQEHQSLITVHRIGVVPEIAKTVEEAMDSGDCYLMRAEIGEIAISRRGLKVTFKDPKRTDEDFDLIVNCLGREQDYSQIEGLWQNLLNQKLACRHAITGIGVSIDREGRLMNADGRASSWISTVGVMREGYELATLGRLGSFSFTLGPLKNQAFITALYTLRRLEGVWTPSAKLGNYKPKRDGSGTKELLDACIDEAWLAEFREEFPGKDRVKSGLDAEAAWEVAVNCLKSRTYNKRLAIIPAIRKFEAEATSALQEAGVRSSERQQRFVRCFRSCLEEVALAHLTRIDEVEPGESLRPAAHSAAALRGSREGGTAAIEQAPAGTFEYDFAFSYSGADRAVVEELANKLRAAGVNVFYDRDYQAKLLGKSLPDFAQSIYRDKSKYCVIFVSKNYLNSENTANELKHAQDREWQNYPREYILPVRLDDTEFPRLNKTVIYVDMRYQDAYRLLLEKLRTAN